MVAAIARALSGRYERAHQRGLPALADGPEEQALEVLERLFARGWGKRDWIDHDPDYDCLRDDPRFKKLLARLK